MKINEAKTILQRLNNILYFLTKAGNATKNENDLSNIKQIIVILDSLKIFLSIAMEDTKKLKMFNIKDDKFKVAYSALKNIEKEQIAFSKKFNF